MKSFPRRYITFQTFLVLQTTADQSSQKRYKQQQLEKQSFKTYDNLFMAVMEEMKEGPSCDFNCLAGKPAWMITPEQDYSDEDSESREDGHDVFDDDGDDSGNGDQLRMEILMLRILAQRRQSTTTLQMKPFDA